MNFKVVGACADDESAARYFVRVESMVDDAFGGAPTSLLSNLTVSTSDRKLLIDAGLNMETMWNFMKTLTSQPHME